MKYKQENFRHDRQQNFDVLNACRKGLLIPDAGLQLASNNISRISSIRV